ncbi:MAG: DUF3810 domain-containing protein [Christensenellales bacterium]|jgi:hypothetical protein
MKIKLKRGRLIALIIVAALITALFILRNSVWVCEYVFARGVFRGYQFVVGRITSILPFSFYELFVLIAIIAGLILFTLLIIKIVKKDWNKVLNGLIAAILTVASVILLYTMTAVMNYNRLPVPLETYEGEAKREDIVAIAEYFANDYSAIAESLDRDENGDVICPYSDRALAKKMQQEFQRLKSPYFNTFTPVAKTMVTSEFMSHNRLLGVYFSPTGEANINKNMPNADKPYTMAHELAHSIGIMREGDANLIAAYITLTSKDDYIRYSGYFNTFYSIRTMVLFMYGETSEEYLGINDMMSAKIWEDHDYNSDYWSKYQSVIDRVSEFFNDTYLKIMGQSEGTGSYDDSYDYGIIETGEINEQGERIYEIDLSDVMRIYLDIYYNG